MDNKFERLLEAYFDGTLSQAEQDDMKALLASNPDFAAEFAWRQSVARAIRTGTGNDPLATKLKELERRFRFRRVILQISALAATLVLLISAVWFFNPPGFLQNENKGIVKQDTIQTVNPPLQTTTPQHDSTSQKSAQMQEELERKQAEEALRRQKEEQRKQRLLRDSMQNAVVANFRHYRNVSPYNTAGSVDAKDSSTIRAFILYDAKEYKQAARAFKPVVEAEPGNLENRFYYGVALLADQQFATAASALQPVTAQQGKYQTPAKFYLGMALSGEGQYRDSRKAFQGYLDAPGNNRQFKDLTGNMLNKLPAQ